MKRARSLGTLMSLFTSLAFILINTVQAIPQTETGQIIVKTVDSQGAVIPGANVAVKSVDTGRSLPSLTTNDAGSATIPNLQPGIYEVTTSASGFADVTQRVEVTVGGKISV